MAGGASVIGLGYDVQGNLANRNGTAHTFTFDYGNRLRTGEQESYRYDVQGRRIRSSSSAGLVYSLYAQSGQLLFQRDERAGKRRQYVYLGGSLVAESSVPLAGGSATVTYQHTDALGSPVATTSSAKAVLQRSEYEPYGYLLNRPMEDGPGYTGHVSDAATGLVYMQQRYYDPVIGHRFLSVDPVTAYSAGGAFNRYWYANANPFGFTDPDGRDPDPGMDPYRLSGGFIGVRSVGPVSCSDCDSAPAPSPSSAAQSQFTPAGAADSALQGVGLAGNGIGAVEVAASSEANAWSAMSSRGAGVLANAAAQNAGDWRTIARGLSWAGGALSFGIGAIETFRANNAGDAFHGVATAALGGAAIAGYVSGPVGLGIGLLDSAAQQARYTSPLTGDSFSGWRAINAAGADAIITQYRRDTELGPIIY